MTTKDENYVSMCRSVNEVFSRYQSVWETNPRFTKEVTGFRELLTNILNTKADSNIVTTGATTDKSEAGMALYNHAVNLGKRASVYALDTDNMELHDRLRTSRGALSNMHDTFALAKSKDIYNQLSVIKDALPDYGVAEAELTDLKARIDAFDALISRPRDLIVERKGHNQTIPEQMQALRKNIYKLDSLINIFDGSPFEMDYRNARKVVNLGSRKSQDSNDAGASNAVTEA